MEEEIITDPDDNYDYLGALNNFGMKETIERFLNCSTEPVLKMAELFNNEFYEDNDKALWKDSNCWYDKEEDDWIAVGESFEEFRKSLNPMRSVDHAGEVAEYMLILTLNDLGKSFLIIFKINLSKYLSASLYSPYK